MMSGSASSGAHSRSMYSPRKLRRSASIQQMMSPVQAYNDFHIALPLPDPAPASGSTDASLTTRAPAWLAISAVPSQEPSSSTTTSDTTSRRTASRTISPMVDASLRAGRHTDTLAETWADTRGAPPAMESGYGKVI